MKIYREAGAAWLVCPRLLEMDRRHADHPGRWPGCRRGRGCVSDHKHEDRLTDSEGHLVVHFRWQAGSEHADHHAAELRCPCGRQLVHGDLDDPWAAAHHQVAGRPHSTAG